MIGKWAEVAGLRLASLVLAAVFVALVPQTMPPEEFGRFNLVMSVLQTAAAVLLSWLNMALLRFGREAFVADGHLGGVLGTRLSLHLVLLVPTLALAWAAAGPLAPWIGADAGWLRAALLAGLPLLSLFDLASYAAQAAGRFAGYGWGPVLLRLAQLAALAMIAAGAAEARWPVLLAGALAGYGLGLGITVAALPGRTWRRLGFSGALARRMLAYARLQPLASGCAIVLSWMDLWFLRWLAGEAEVGIYAWAYAVTLMAMTLLVPLAAVLAPRAIDRHLAADTGSVRATLAGVGAGCALLAAAVPAGLAVVAAVTPVLPLGAYAAAMAPILLLAAGIVFQLGSSAVEPMVYAREEQAPAMGLVMLASVAANAVCDLALIPVLGLAGAALGTAAAYGTAMVLVWLLAARRAGGGPSPWPPLVLGMAGMTAAGAMAALPPAAAAATGLVSAAILFAVARRGGLLDGLAPLSGRMGRGRAGRLLAWVARVEAA